MMLRERNHGELSLLDAKPVINSIDYDKEPNPDHMLPSNTPEQSGYKTPKQPHFITNAEVYRVLKENKEAEFKAKSRSKKQPLLPVDVFAKLRNSINLRFELMDYLKPTHVTKQNDAIMVEVLTNLMPYKLTKFETLQVLNLRPQSHPELYLIIEKIDLRFSPEQLDAIIEIVSAFPEGKAAEEARLKREKEEQVAMAAEEEEGGDVPAEGGEAGEMAAEDVQDYDGNYEEGYDEDYYEGEGDEMVHENANAAVYDTVDAED